MDVKEALEMYEDYQQGWREIYEKAKDDLNFYIGKDNCQWDDKALKARTALGRPCLTVNVLPQFVHQVSNQIRQNTPSINVLPSDVKSSEETAKVQKWLIRKIEYESGADEIYDTAATYAVVSSIGFIRVNHDYVSSDSFKQHITIERVQNPLACWIDPASVECDGGDSNGAIIITTITKKDFEKKYPGKAFTSFETSESARKESTTKDEGTIAEIYKLDYETSEKQQNEDGSVADFVDDGKKGKKTRKLKKTIIRRYIFSGADKLEESIFPCHYIPLIPVYGQEIWVDGKRNLISLIRNAKDPQRRYNHWSSIENEILDKLPLAPWMAAAGATEDFAADWVDPDTSNLLRYKTTDIDGNPVPPPQRINVGNPAAHALNAKHDAYEDIKRAMGLYDASVGQKSNETSGIAIEARQQQGDVATFHFPDNLARSVAQVGRVIISMIPQIYDTAQILQIVDDEEQPQFVGVNGMAVEGQDVMHMLTEGQYDVRVTTGRGYSSRLQEGSAKLGEILGQSPEMMGVFGDLWAKGLDIPFAEQLAERIKKTIDPKLLVEDKPGQAPDPEKEMMAAQMEQMQAQLQEVMPIVEGKQQEAQAKQAEMMMNQEAKQAELGLKQQEMAMKYELESKKLENEQIKLQLEAEKLQLEREKMIMAAQAPQEQPAQPAQPSAIKLDTTGFQFMKTPEQEAMEAGQAEESAMKEAEERTRKDEELALAHQERMAVIQALMSIAQGVENLNQRVGQPMQVVRDVNGSIVGAAPVTIN